MIPRTILRMLASATIAACAFGEESAAQTDHVSAVAESTASANYAWFDTLGFSGVKDAKFVRVFSGNSYTAGEPPEPNYFHGFLLREEDGDVTVVSTQLQLTILTKTGRERPPESEQMVGEVSLAAYAAGVLNPPKLPSAKVSWRRFGERLSERAEMFVVARACAQRGLAEQAAALYMRASSLPLRNQQTAGEGTFRERLERDLGHAMMWSAIETFGDPKIGRRELLEKFQAIIKNYPHSEHLARAEATAELLEKMIAEEDAHPAVSDEDLAKLPVEQQAAELIFRLRDQNGHQWSQPGSCDIFGDLGGLDGREQTSPAHRLVEIGFPAVPQLIAALGNRTFTRSVGYHRDFYFSHTVLRVGDCAEAILARIAGRNFYVARTTSGYMSADGKVDESRAAIEAWWSEFQGKGEQAVLIEATRRGDRLAPSQAKRLIERYPTEAGAALVAGASAAKETWTRASLIRLAEQVDEPPVAEFLRRELEKGPYLSSRLAAAHVLHRRGDPRAIEAMIREWQSRPKPPKRSKDLEPPADDSRADLIGFLAGADSPAGIAALAEHLDEQPVDVRCAVVTAFRPAGNFSGGSSGPGLSFVNTDRDKAPAPAVAAAMERLLAGRLEDVEERVGLGGAFGDKPFNDPRICDLAACALASGWKDRYRFDLAGSAKVRERQRIECLNVWRTSQGTPQLPLPVSSKTPRPAEEASFVTEIRFEAAKDEPLLELKRAAEALRGKALTSDAFVALLVNFTRAPGTALGLQLRANRDEDLTGITLSLRVIPRASKQKLGLWGLQQRVVLGTKQLYSSGGSASVDHVRELAAWRELKSAIDEALASAPALPVAMRVDLKLERSFDAEEE